MLSETDKLIEKPDKNNSRPQLRSELLFWSSVPSADELRTEELIQSEYQDVTAQEIESSYEPFAHRTIDHSTSNFETFVHLLKGCVGATSISAMPGAFKNSGLILGPVGLVVIGVLCTYSVHLLVNCARELSKRTRTPLLTYTQVCELSFKCGPPFLRSFSNAARHIVNMFLCLYLLGDCCIFYLFGATNLQMLIRVQFGIDWNVKIYVAILLPALIFLNWIRNLKFLSPVMTVANVSMYFGLGIIFYYIFREISLNKQGKDFPNFNPSSFKNLALYFGTIVYALDGITVILPIENQMKNPQNFGGWKGLLNMTMLIAAVPYIAVGFFGYLAYGGKVADSVTLNLPQGDWLASTVQIVMLLSVILTYPLVFYVLVELTWPPMERRVKVVSLQKVAEYAFRVLLVLFTFLLAEFVPHLGPGISFVGSFCVTTLGLIFPAIFSLCTNWAVGYGTLRWKMWKDLTLLLLGMMGCLVGTYASLLEILYDT